MKRFLWAALMLLVPTLPAFGQAVTSTVAYGPATVTGSSSGINEQRSGTQFHQLVWRVTGTIASCTVAVDSSADGITWSAGGVITGQNCTSNGTSAAVSSVVNFVRVTATALSGGGTLTAVYSGYATNPLVGTVTSVATTSPVTGGPITTSGTIACATCVTAASALTSNQVVVGGGSQASAVAPYLIGDGTTQLSIGPADTVNNGILGLKGKTSGTATLTAPSVAGTNTNPITISNVIALPIGSQNNVAVGSTASVNSGLFFDASGEPALSAGGSTGAYVKATSGNLIAQHNIGMNNNSFSVDCDVCFNRQAAGIVGVASATGSGTDGKVKAAGYMSVGTTFTSSGGCTEGTLVGGATAGKFTTSGTTSCTTVITMGNSATAPNGWACSCKDLTTAGDANNCHQSASNATTATLVTGTIVASDVIQFFCIGY